jgi:WD40 repeat protein
MYLSLKKLKDEKKWKILARCQRLPAPLTRSLSLRSGTVTEVKFASQHIIASNSADGRTKVWDLRTGQETAEAVPQGLFSKGCSAQEQRVNGYVVAAKGNTLCIFRTTGVSVGSEDAATGRAHSADGEGRGKTEETAPVAFFQCDSEIIALDVSGLQRSSMASSNIVVGCVDGQVLQLWAAVLKTRG